MIPRSILTTLFCISVTGVIGAPTDVPKPTTTINVCCSNEKTLTYSEDWDYYQVRTSANLFWWLYFKSTSDGTSTNEPRPLILWLQGGPGASGVGFGNFQELGPIDFHLNENPQTWLQKGDLIFVDNPVGTGYSYVNDDSAYTTDVDQIADDMVSFLVHFFNDRHPEYKPRPFWIFCESYGGKMTAAIGLKLYETMAQGKLTLNFAGVALGDSWISPMDYVWAWGPYLYQLNYLDDNALKTYSNLAQQCQHMVNNNLWEAATDCWGSAEELVSELTDDVSWYNVLKKGNTDPWSLTGTSYEVVQKDQTQQFRPKLTPKEKALLKEFEGSLSDLLNGPIKEKLGIIPNFVTWGGQGGAVFDKQGGDFMKPVIDTVDKLLMNTTLTVAIFQGQLDLICCTSGTEQWMRQLKWEGMDAFNGIARIPFSIPDSDQTAGFHKQYRQFNFFWIMRAGHMVAHDADKAALMMLDKLF